MMLKLFYFCLVDAVVTATAVDAVATKSGVRLHRRLDDCVIPLAGPDSEVQQSVLNQACAVDLNHGVDLCIVTIPDNVLQDYKTECQAAGGQYLGLVDARYTCFAPSVCDPLAGSSCFAFDNMTCVIDPNCTITDSGCKMNPFSGCFPVAYDFLWTEKPKCIDSSCDCESTAAGIVEEAMNKLETNVNEAYADYTSEANVNEAYANYTSAIWTCVKDDLDNTTICNSGALGVVLNFFTVTVIAFLLQTLF